MGGRGSQISQFKVSLFYRASSRIARATQKNPVWKQMKQNERGRMNKRKTGRQTEREKKERKKGNQQVGLVIGVSK